MELFEMYESLGVSREVWAYGEQVLEGLKERFAAFEGNTGPYLLLSLIHI